MALFHRKEQEHSEALYTTDTNYGQDNSWLIIGLGNPEPKYNLTRHNIGFYCVDKLVENEGKSWSVKTSLKSQVSDIKIGSVRLILCKPTTYMNLSGEAAKAMQQYFKISSSQTIAIHDELDIEFGQIRSRIGGGSAGHNGVKSLIQHIGPEFGRIRIGVANEFSERVDSADFVLQKFNKSEQESMKLLSNEAISIINEAVFSGSLLADTRNFL